MVTSWAAELASGTWPAPYDRSASGDRAQSHRAMPHHTPSPRMWVPAARPETWSIAYLAYELGRPCLQSVDPLTLPDSRHRL
jgi:hypothetical protein